MPPETIVAFPQPVWDEIVAALDRKNESAGLLLAGVAEDETRLTYTVNRVVWVPDEHYIERAPKRMSIASAGWVPALKTAVDAGLKPIFFHTHPAEKPTPSKLDDVVDEALAGPSAHVPALTAIPASSSEARLNAQPSQGVSLRMTAVSAP